MSKYTPEQLSTLERFTGRWAAANTKVNEGSYYQNYQFPNARLNELVTDFTQEQREFIQSTLDDARGVIGHVNILK